ncbi:MAG TPA: protein-disulfide reductase DsbD, partial [Agitococcus sp.]|nr:protein-disulfide reductase DsbD [Agitococcus sp.]
MRLWPILLLATSINSVQAAVPSFDDIPAEEDYLEVGQAFQPVVKTTDGHVQMSFTIADGYYLYKKRISIQSTDNNHPVVMGDGQFSQKAEIKNDPNFGRVEIFHKTLAVEIPVYAQNPQDVGQITTVKAIYQGCSQQGLCYPPQTIKANVKLLQLAPTPTVDTDNLTTVNNSASVGSKKTDTNDANSLSQFLAGSSLGLILATFLVLGIGLSFTPCVLPMVPILSGIIAGQGQGLSAKRGFLLSLSYVVGMATTYALAGMAVGYFGASANLSAWMQSPVVLSVFAGIFVLLALAMFGFYELRLPAFIQDRLSNLNQKQQGGTYFGVLLMGILSALVVSPCVSAPLAGALLYISSTGDMWLGGAALLALGLGMGTPLLLIGVGGGSLIPKAGSWMVVVKSVFGVLLLMVAIWLLSRFLAGAVTLVLWGLLLIVCGILMGALDNTQAGWQRFWKGLGVALLVWGVLLLVGAANGQSNPLRPLQFSSTSNKELSNKTELTFRKVNNAQELEVALAEAKQQGKVALLDFYADWCVACVEMAHDTFSSPIVANALKPVVLLQADITSNDDNAQAMLKR